MKFSVVLILSCVLVSFGVKAENPRGVEFSITYDSDDVNGKLEAMQTKVLALESKLESHLVEFEKLKNLSRNWNYVARRSCDDVARQGFTTDGVYTIILNEKVVEVYCEFDDNGGNWLVFQRRSSGEVNFELNWLAYKNGFGNKNGEFWLGLSNLNAITTSGSYKLRVELEDWEGNTAYAEYSSITVGNFRSNYRLNIGRYHGTAGDSLIYHNNQQFTTQDRDHDHNGGNCARDLHGGWWFNYCHRAHLNGRYFVGGVSSSTGQGLNWYTWRGFHVSMKSSKMKLQLA